MNVPKKWWWVAAIVVPLTVALVNLVPKLTSKHKPDGTFIVQGSQHLGDVAFNRYEVVVDQAEALVPGKLPADLLTELRRGTALLQQRQFDKGISVLATLVDRVPAPALYSNLGAAYLAQGASSQAQEYFDLAGPEDRAVRFNRETLRVQRRNSEPTESPLVKPKLTTARMEAAGAETASERCSSLLGPTQTLASGGDSFASAAELPLGRYVSEYSLKFDIYRYFRTRLQSGQTLLVRFRTADELQVTAGASIYDFDGGLLAQDTAVGRSAKGSVSATTDEDTLMYVSVGSHAGMTKGSVYCFDVY